MTTERLSVPGGVLAYDSVGCGPLVIGIPSMGDLRAEYRFLAPQLVGAGYRVVSLDLRGHGESSTHWADYSLEAIGQDVLALVRALNAGPAIVVGDSVGAAAAVWSAAEAPELVRGIVLLGPAVRGEMNLPFRLFLTAFFARPWGPRTWIAFFNRLFPTRKPADFTAYTAALHRNLAEPGRLEALRRMMVLPKRDFELRAQRTKASTLVLMGTLDPDFKDPTAEATWIAGQLRAELSMIKGAGHYPHVEMPEIVGPRIIEFLKTLEPEAEHAGIVYATAQA